MKKPEEYIQDDSQYEVMNSDEELYKWNNVENMIKQAQKDAYNEALEDAAENATVINCDGYFVDIDSILKLLKDE